MIVIYKCEHCLTDHETEEDCNKCEANCTKNSIVCEACDYIAGIAEIADTFDDKFDIDKTTLQDAIEATDKIAELMFRILTLTKHEPDWAKEYKQLSQMIQTTDGRTTTVLDYMIEQGRGKYKE
jgi:hypothetical protein